MNRLAQEMKFRQEVFNYARLNGVTKATKKYRVNRQFIYRMKWKYDGTPELCQNPVALTGIQVSIPTRKFLSLKI